MSSILFFKNKCKTQFFWIVICISLVTNIVTYLTLNGKALAFVSDLLPVVFSFASVFLVGKTVRSFKTYDFAKWTWLFIFLGLVLNFIAESTYGTMELFLGYDMNETFPSVADCFWYGGYVFFFMGLMTMLSGYKKSGLPFGNIRSYLIETLLITTIFIVVIYFLLVPILADKETGTIAKIAYLLYPVFDILVASLAIILMLIVRQFGKASITMPWITLASGFIFFAISDILYSYLGWQDIYGNGNLIDVGWNIGYLLIGISGLYQNELVQKYSKGE